MRGKKYELKKSQTVHEGIMTKCDNPVIVDIELSPFDFEMATHHGYLKRGDQPLPPIKRRRYVHTTILYYSPSISLLLLIKYSPSQRIGRSGLADLTFSCLLYRCATSTYFKATNVFNPSTSTPVTFSFR